MEDAESDLPGKAARRLRFNAAAAGRGIIVVYAKGYI